MNVRKSMIQVFIVIQPPSQLSIDHQFSDDSLNAFVSKDSGDQGESIQVGELVDRLSRVELENKQLRALVEQLEKRLGALDGKAPSAAPAAKPAAPAAAKKPNSESQAFK